GFDFSLKYGGGTAAAKPGTAPAASQAATTQATAGTAASQSVEKEIAVMALINAYRSRGHLESTTNPVRKRRDRNARLQLSDFALTEADLDTVFYAGNVLGIGTVSLRKIIESLKHIYTGTIGFEYTYIREPEIRDWFTARVEQDSLTFNPAPDYKKRILSKLNEAVVFENFLHTKYVGQKRFSLEGGETTIPALDAIISTAADLGVEEVAIGMAHRGRLNVLCNIMGKTYEHIFNEFEGTATPDLTMGDGDVKYHMGYSSQHVTEKGKHIYLKLAPNPSHLETVDSVVEGYTRSKSDSTYGGDTKKVLPLLLHGDAALAGQGLVYEIAQMAALKGYNTGGTIHFVINNQVGFTTDFEDARSSIYSTDVAKITDSPVLHVNGDDPEAVVFCVKLATEFRQKFGRDVYVDMVCYRRHGHNESDEPKFTQPELYNIIARHANPREVYNQRLTERGEVDAKLAETMDKEFRDLLQDRLNMIKQNPQPYAYQKMDKEWQSLRRSKAEDFLSSPETGISQETIDKVANALIKTPEGFRPIKQVEKLLKDRREMFFESKKLNWAAAELLAYGSLLSEGKLVRLSGQDVERGTFSHRHAVIHDAENSKPYSSLDFIGEGQAKMNIFNSLLSEYGVLGFEFGYAMANPNALTIWEAQFGDFGNGAQVMIDQYIVCSETKWQRMNGLVMLLPHGYEGQGPEHSNARPERFLQLCAENNIVVANVTLPANFFHLMRRQLTWEFRKPCVVMSPKSMLRHPLCVSPIEDFTSGKFKEVITDSYATGKGVKKVLLVSGKLYWELYEKQQAEKRTDIAIVRLEQLHPFPAEQVEAALKPYGKARVAWVQEEPENMGALSYVSRKMQGKNIEFVSRKASASPASGYNKVHVKEQAEVINQAFAV
ncbi:MAG: 2-oxoglutarate dehydrogenase E1 component, partial [Bacteroidota bacterium]